MSLTPRHQPAFKNTIIDYLSIKPESIFLDCTLGDGSHTEAALKIGAKVISLDLDQDSIDRARQFISDKLQNNWFVFRENFANVANLFEKEKLPQPDAILFDLGTSQAQLAVAGKGFSFQIDGPLDMRLDNRLQVTATDLVNALSENELTRLFRELGDELYAKKIAVGIITTRQIKKIETTKELADLVAKIKKTRQKIHPATKIFQALRMAVNLERESLSIALPASFKLLKPKGKLAIISFHSGEDRIVKYFFRSLAKEGKAVLLNQKPIKPNLNELQINSKIRSAKLRLAIKK